MTNSYAIANTVNRLFVVGLIQSGYEISKVFGTKLGFNENMYKKPT